MIFCSIFLTILMMFYARKKHLICRVLGETNRSNSIFCLQTLFNRSIWKIGFKFAKQHVLLYRTTIKYFIKKFVRKRFLRIHITSNDMGFILSNICFLLKIWLPWKKTHCLIKYFLGIETTNSNLKLIISHFRV